MNHNKVSVIHGKAFEGLDTLEILTLYENKIYNVEVDAFKGLEKYLIDLLSKPYDPPLRSTLLNSVITYIHNII